MEPLRSQRSCEMERASSDDGGGMEQARSDAGPDGRHLWFAQGSQNALRRDLHQGEIAPRLLPPPLGEVAERERGRRGSGGFAAQPDVRPSQSASLTAPPEGEPRGLREILVRSVGALIRQLR